MVTMRGGYPDGVWHNQHGSVLTLNALSGAGATLGGSFESGVGFPRPGQRFPVVGFHSGRLLVFCVDFLGFDSLTSWCGHVLDAEGGPVLHTLWHMAVRLPPTAQEKAQGWMGLWSGSDTFVRDAPRVPVALSGAQPSHPVPEHRK